MAAPARSLSLATLDWTTGDRRRRGLLGVVCRAALLAAPSAAALGIALPDPAQAATTLTGSHGATVLLQNYSNPFFLAPGSSFTGLPGISGNSSQAWTITNQGVVSSGGDGIDLASGSTVTNYTQISGVNGITMSGGLGTVLNSGTILATDEIGVNLQGGGFVRNSQLGTVAASFPGSFNVDYQPTITGSVTPF